MAKVHFAFAPDLFNNIDSILQTVMYCFPAIIREGSNNDIFPCGPVYVNNAAYTIAAVCSTSLGKYAKLEIQIPQPLAYYPMIFTWAYQTDGSRNVSTRTAVEQRQPGSGNELSLSPNPFNPQTIISYPLRKRGRVIIEVYDAQGVMVRRVRDAEEEAGRHVLTWNAGGLPSGVYLCRLGTTDGFTATRRVLLLK
jgi:hypothetical protein